jgi:hypothetical protein
LAAVEVRWGPFGVDGPLLVDVTTRDRDMGGIVDEDTPLVDVQE